MQFFKLVVLSLLSLASARQVLPRSASSIRSAIGTISDHLSTFDENIKAFTGEPLQALGLLSAYNTLDSDIKSATSTVKSTGALASSDSATIYSDITSLTTQITGTLGDMVDKASTIRSAGYTSIVLNALKTLKSDSDAFFVALEGTIDSAYTSQLAAVQDTVDSAFDAAIAAYN